ncbi:MAG TPA: PQQ-dependent dehydrogenase, methanol/ethanol family [Candidatus Cybelea sp.]|jgi:quinohemoprotein ethanol dehydrogenase|nr:PQQ-dependent dehydrogenase, methanol/ethanol family [Candidatus Cybelea sp.]
MSARLRTVSAIALAAALSLAGFYLNRSAALADDKPAGQIDRKRLLAADKHPGEWLTAGRDFGKGHFSPLAQINVQTVERLGFAWDYDTHTNRGLEATPIVVDGVMYTSGSTGKAYALDAKTGKELWSFDPKSDLRVNREACCDEVNRGVAVWKGRVYVASFDGNLFALDAASGSVLWQADTITNKKVGYTVTGAPEVAGNVVVIGNSGGEYDARGYVSAYDLVSGKMAWRFFTVPGDPSKPQENPELDAAVKTWDPKSRWDMGGGGTVWDSMVYDPELNLLYFGTGNGTFFDQSRRSPAGGDNLYIASILAINPDTGRLVWHYQEVPGDQWDFDTLQPIVLASLKIGGKTRKILMQASKDGFFYIIDRKTGEVLSAEKFVPVTWASHVDLKTGRPVEVADARNYKYSSNGKGYISPSPMGGHNWNPMSYDPDNGLVYIPSIENGQTGIFTGKAFLRAWDPIQSKVVWDVPMSDWWDRPGVLATAGGLVFQGTGPGHFCAYDAATGKKLKDIDVGTTIIAAPMSYSLDGVQYVAVMAAWGGGGWNFAHPESAAYQRGNEGRLIVFKLDGGATPKPDLLPPIQPIPQPPPLTASAETVKRGATLFAANCATCHANQPRTGTPDLRRMSTESHDAFKQIVLGGALEKAGMPPWAGVLTPEDADAIHAFLISLAWDGYNKQQAAPKN